MLILVKINPYEKSISEYHAKFHSLFIRLYYRRDDLVGKITKLVSLIII